MKSNNCLGFVISIGLVMLVILFIVVLLEIIVER